MKVLLDTHAFVWWMGASEKLPPSVIALVGNRENQILISAAVAWELAIKVSLGKIKPAVPISEVPAAVEGQGFAQLEISLDHAVRAGTLPRLHGDPFDRMLIAQALAEDIPIVSNDRAFDKYGVRRLW